MEELDRTDPGEAVKVATRELIAHGVFELRRIERLRRWRAPRSELTLVATGVAPPELVPLTLIYRALIGAPLEHHGGVDGRPVRATARHIARTWPRIGEEIVDAVAFELHRQGLVTWEDRRRGLRRREQLVRTAAGDERLGVDALWRRRRDRDRDRSDFDADFDADFDGGFEGGDGGGDGGGGE